MKFLDVIKQLEAKALFAAPESAFGSIALSKIVSRKKYSETHEKLLTELKNSIGTAREHVCLEDFSCFVGAMIDDYKKEQSKKALKEALK